MNKSDELLNALDKSIEATNATLSTATAAIRGLRDELGKKPEYVPEVHDTVYDNECACGATIASVDKAGGCVLCYHDGGSQPAIKTRGFAKHELPRLIILSRGEPQKGDKCIAAEEFGGRSMIFRAKESSGLYLMEDGGRFYRKEFRIIEAAPAKREPRTWERWVSVSEDGDINAVYTLKESFFAPKSSGAKLVKARITEIEGE